MRYALSIAAGLTLIASPCYATYLNLEAQSPGSCQKTWSGKIDNLSDGRVFVKGSPTFQEKITPNADGSFHRESHVLDNGGSALITIQGNAKTRTVTISSQWGCKFSGSY